MFTSNLLLISKKKKKKKMMGLTYFFVLLFFTLTTKAIGLGIGIGGGGISIGGGSSGGYGSYGPVTPPKKPPPPPPPRGLQRCDFVNDKQYEAYKVIQRFKSTITCDPLGKTANWVGPRICNYTGFRCEAPPNAPGQPTIAAIDFNRYTLSAPTIAGFVDKLPDLAFFHMNTNKFGGTLPALSNLQFLYEIDVSNNILSGSYPDFAVAGLKNLLFYDLRYNTFSGCLPGSVFNIKLSVLFLNNNNFGSPLPDNLGSTTAQYLTLANNGFTGPIPRSICNAGDTLIEVIFLNNRLSGCLPAEIGSLRIATVFDIGDNKITGPIPKSFGCLAKIEQLNLANNLLYGEVPEVVCKLPNLLNFTIAGNYFTSLGPSCRQLIAKKKLDVRNNCFPDLPNQRSPEECYKFACKPKSCPVQTFVPCYLSYYSLPEGVVGGESLSSPAYNALHH